MTLSVHSKFCHIFLLLFIKHMLLFLCSIYSYMQNNCNLLQCYFFTVKQVLNNCQIKIKMGCD